MGLASTPESYIESAVCTMPIALMTFPGWRLKLVAELGSGPVSEVEVARSERDKVATAETIGLTLDEGKRLTAAARVEIVRGQVAVLGRRSHTCEYCGTTLSSMGHYPTTFRTVFGDMPTRTRRMCTCPCRADTLEPRSFAVLTVGGAAPELAYVTARFSALAPFARVADLLCALLPIGGAANPGTLRNRTCGLAQGWLHPTRLPPGCPLPKPCHRSSSASMAATCAIAISGRKATSRSWQARRSAPTGVNAAFHSLAAALGRSRSGVLWRGLRCPIGHRPLCCRTAMLACGTYSVTCFLTLRSCWTGSISPCVSIMPCEPQPGSARERWLLGLASDVTETSSARSGAYGTVAGKAA